MSLLLIDALTALQDLFSTRKPTDEHPASSKLVKTLLECQPMPRRPDLAQVVAPGAESGCIAPTKQLPEENQMKHP